MRDNSRTPFYVFIFVALVGAATAIIVLIGNPRGQSTPTALPALVTSATVPTITQPTARDLLLNEDFEDGKADDFRFTLGDWQVVDDDTDNKVLEAHNLDYSLSDWPRADFGPITLGDYTIEYRVKLIEYDTSKETGSGMTWLGFRETVQGSYVFNFTPHWHELGIAYSTRNAPWENLEGQNGLGQYDFRKNVWYSVRVEAYGTQIKAYLDEKLIFAVNDTRLKDGILSLHTGPNTIAQFDNVRVSK